VIRRCLELCEDILILLVKATFESPNTHPYQEGASCAATRHSRAARSHLPDRPAQSRFLLQVLARHRRKKPSPRSAAFARSSAPPRLAKHEEAPQPPQRRAREASPCHERRPLSARARAETRKPGAERLIARASLSGIERVEEHPFQPWIAAPEQAEQRSLLLLSGFARGLPVSLPS
jgi:hypothetical protein